MPALAPPLTAALDRLHRGEAASWDALMALRAQARAAGETHLALQAGAGALIAAHHFWRFDRFDELLADLSAVCDGGVALDAADELLVLNGLLIGLLLGRAHDPRTDALAERLRVQVEAGLDVNLTLAAARTLIVYLDERKLHAVALRLHATVAPRCAEPGAVPYRVGQWLNLWWRFAYFNHQAHLAGQAMAKMRELAQTHGLRRLEFTTALSDFAIVLASDDVAAAQAALARAEELVDPCALPELTVLERSKSRLASIRGQMNTALQHATRARELAQLLQLPPTLYSVYVVSEAQALLHGEQFTAARELLRSQLQMLAATYAVEVEAMLQGVEVCCAVQEKRGDVDQRLTALWRGMRERRNRALFIDFPKLDARLCVLALERGIEIDFVASYIVQQRMAAPPDAPGNWPWPLRIQALGGFVVWRDGLLVGAEGKSQRRPLALLQAVIALGGFAEDRGVEVSKLVDLLWADEDAAYPKASFENALARLRRWLGVEGALKMSDGRLALNARLVWCDVGAFERGCDDLQRALDVQADMAQIRRLVARLEALYRGPLFGGAAPEAWSVQARERLAARFARAVADAGRHFETHRCWDEALRLYDSALQQDMLAEPLHRALMRCLLALGRAAEARRALERCRAVLSASLGVAPSPETVRLLERAAPAH